MGKLIFGFIVGLIIGWNILPQPVWVKSLWNKIMSKFKKHPSEPADSSSQVVENKPTE